MTITISKRYELVTTSWNDAQNAERKSDADRLGTFVTKWTKYGNELIDTVLVLANEKLDESSKLTKDVVMASYGTHAKSVVAAHVDSKGKTLELINFIDSTFGFKALRQSETSRAIAFVRYGSTKDSRTVAEFIRLHKDHVYADGTKPKIGLASFATWIKAVAADKSDKIDDKKILLQSSGGSGSVTKWTLKTGVDELFSRLVKDEAPVTKRNAYDVAGLFDGGSYDHDAARTEVKDMIASLAAWLIMDSKGRVDHESGLVTGR